MPGMVMNSGGDVTKTSNPGVYRVKLKPEMGGDWVVKLFWKGPAGEGQVEIPVSVKEELPDGTGSRRAVDASPEKW